jgi:disulfide bond formation protein DsbB
VLEDFWHEKLGIEFSPFQETKEFLSKYFMELSFLIALTSTSGSLYMSNILGWEPCHMCWLQRIFMYPLVIVLGVGLLFSDKNARDYALPLALIGFPIAFYHSLLQRFNQFQSAGCSVTSVSCSTEYTFWFGYITIPVMAAVGFAAIIFLMWRFGGRRSN